MLLGMDLGNNVQIFIDNGSGKNRKLLELNLCDPTDQQKKSLVGMHGNTGNDYVSSFHCKGKSYAGDLSVMIKHSWIYFVGLARKYT